MHKEYIPENMANKYYFGEADSSAHQRIVDVVVYKTEDDEEIGVIELYYDYDKINERLWYDYSLQENLSGYIPYGYLSRHFKYAVQDFFKKHFPDYGVREITAASLVSY